MSTLSSRFEHPTVETVALYNSSLSQLGYITIAFMKIFRLLFRESVTNHGLLRAFIRVTVAEFEYILGVYMI